MAALSLFAQKGYHSTSVSAIAKKAGVSKGLIYNYYVSKEDLLKGLIVRVMSEGHQFYEVIQSKDLKPNEALRQLFLVFKRNLLEKKDFWKLAISLSIQEELGRFEFIRKMMGKNIDIFLNAFVSLLKKKGVKNAQEEALVIGALFDGISYQYIIAGDVYPLEKMIKILIKRYCS